jgi:ABC-type sugar transport system substrate-binding protein
MIDIATLRVGQKVHYQPAHYGEAEWENGIIKEIREGRKDGVWVVYNCAGNWDRFQDYTGALTHLRDLKPGWRNKP